MKILKAHRSAKAAILAIAEIKAAIAAFDRGEANALDVLESVRATAAAHGVVVPPRTHRFRRRAA